jgi:hypothetical protein
MVEKHGIPAESHLDTGDRAAFANHSGAVRPHPGFAARKCEAYGCAPLVVTGVVLDAVKRSLRSRVESLERRGVRLAMGSQDSLCPMTRSQRPDRLIEAGVPSDSANRRTGTITSMSVSIWTCIMDLHRIYFRL